MSDSLDSTNAEALRQLGVGGHCSVCNCRRATNSRRGRRGRCGSVRFGENLYFSLLIKNDRGVKGLEGLSLVIGLAVVSALRKVGVQSLGLKWPNDVLASGRKIAGVLLELSGDLADVCHVVIGVGINTNMLSNGKDRSGVDVGKYRDRHLDRQECFAVGIANTA